jgi:hypothetical protein
MNPFPDPDLEIDDEEEINRVRAARRLISERFGNDPYRLVAHYIKMQEEQARRRQAEPAPSIPK